MNAYAVVTQFEAAVASYTSAPYAVAVDCCTSALFLSCKYTVLFMPSLVPVDRIAFRVPAKTYCSVPMAVLHAGGKVALEDRPWVGAYQLWPYPIWDAAKRFRRGMFAELKAQHGQQVHCVCLSFHAKKHLPIGRGGMILTDIAEAAAWFRRARYDGREGKPYAEERIEMLGFHCYMTPEQAARGLMLLEAYISEHGDGLPDQVEDYPDLRQMPVFAEHRERAA